MADELSITKVGRWVSRLREMIRAPWHLGAAVAAALVIWVPLVILSNL